MKKGWQTKRLGDVCAFDKAQGIHRGLPYVGLEHIESHTARFIGSSEPQPVKSSTFRFSDEHVLYGRLRPYLNKALAPDFEGHCSTEIFPLKPRPELSREYLLFWLLADETCDRINETCTGARMPRAQMNDVLSFEIPVPPLAEQQRIVGLLDEAFEGLATAKANAEKNLQNARALFESHLQSVFTQRGPGWVAKRLDEACVIIMGQSPDGETYNTGGEGMPLINGPVEFSPDSFGKTVRSKFTTKPTKLCKKDDLILCVRGSTTGRMNISGFDACVGRGVAAIRAREYQPWINHFINAKREEIYRLGTGATFPNVSGAILGGLKLSVPALSTQKEIVNKLDDLLEETQRLARLYERKHAALEALKKSLLHQAFTGAL